MLVLAAFLERSRELLRAFNALDTSLRDAAVNRRARLLRHCSSCLFWASAYCDALPERGSSTAAQTTALIALILKVLGAAT
jgi:hypothetical protein